MAVIPIFTRYMITIVSMGALLQGGCVSEDDAVFLEQGSPTEPDMDIALDCHSDSVHGQRYSEDCNGAQQSADLPNAANLETALTQNTLDCSSSEAKYVALSFAITVDGNELGAPSSIVQVGKQATLSTEGPYPFRLDYEVKNIFTDANGNSLATVSTKIPRSTKAGTLRSEAELLTKLDGNIASVALEADNTSTVLRLSATMLSNVEVYDMFDGKGSSAVDCNVGNSSTIEPLGCCGGRCANGTPWRCCGAVSCCNCGVCCNPP